MDEEEEYHLCPLCVEEMDLQDKNFLPCPCGYRVCIWCWHHIREEMNGLCPACRKPYDNDPHVIAAVDRQEIVKKNREKKQKEKAEKKLSEKPSSSKAVSSLDKKHLHNYRVVQRNLVYIIGLPQSASSEEILKRPEYFGQYGKILKVVVHKNHNLSSHGTISAYITFAYKEDARAAIQALDGFMIEGHQLRASFGTTKYCNNFIRNINCTNPECVYLHEMGEEDDRFTKEEIQAGHTKLNPSPGKDQSIVTGNGGPSGTGKKLVGEAVLPPPVFIQDIANTSSTTSTNTNSATASPSIKPVSLSRNTSVSNYAAVSGATSTQDNASNQAETSPKPEVTAWDSSKVKSPLLTSLPPASIAAAASSSTSSSASTTSTPLATPTSSIPVAIPTSAAITSNDSKNKILFKNEEKSANEFKSSSEFSSNTNDIITSKIQIDFFIDEKKRDEDFFMNGITHNFVFPISKSNYESSIWSNIKKNNATNTTLSFNNPYGNFLFSDIIDFTLPPVDVPNFGIQSKNIFFQNQSINSTANTSNNPSVVSSSASTTTSTNTTTSSTSSINSTANNVPTPVPNPAPTSINYGYIINNANNNLNNNNEKAPTAASMSHHTHHTPNHSQQMPPPPVHLAATNSLPPGPVGVGINSMNTSGISSNTLSNNSSDTSKLSSLRQLFPNANCNFSYVASPYQAKN